ncbi:hypothetical protein Tco_0559455 [Tanacetum coccineum]
MTSLLCNKFKGGKDKVMLLLAIRVILPVLGEIIQANRKRLSNAMIVKVKDTWRDPSILDDQAAQTTIVRNCVIESCNRELLLVGLKIYLGLDLQVVSEPGESLC